MSDLTTLRDHARSRADWRPGDARDYCQSNRWRIVGGERHPEPWHEGCHSDRCGCECHRPTDAERRLWMQIATELDGYFAATTNQTQIWNRPAETDLFGEQTAEPTARNPVADEARAAIAEES